MSPRPLTFHHPVNILLYTAVTRAAQCVVILGSKETVRKMIARGDEQKRYTDLLNRIKEKYRRKINECSIFNDNIKYELLQRLEGMKNHTKLCHGDFNPSNIIINEKGEYYVIDWSHATQGDASADCARTFLLFSIQGKADVAEKYLDLFAEKSGIPKSHIQRWIPIVAATQMTKGKPEEAEFLAKWVDVIDYE